MEPQTADGPDRNLQQRITMDPLSFAEQRSPKAPPTYQNVPVTQSIQPERPVPSEAKDPEIIIEEAPLPQFDYQNWDRYGTGFPPLPPCTYRFLPDIMSWLFGCYGYIVGKVPWLILIIGLATGFGACSGLMKIRLSTDSNDLVNQFMEQGSRYFSDDDIVSAWKNTTQSLDSLSNSAYANKPAGSTTHNSRKKRQALENACDWWTYGDAWRYEAVIIVAKNDSLVAQETMEEAFKLVYFIRELLQCDLDDEMDQPSRIFCCDSWDLLRMKSEIYPGDYSVGSDAAQLMTAFFSTVTYPADKRFRLTETIFTNSLGGVVRRDLNNGYNSRITAIKAMQFQYFLPVTMVSIDAESKLTATLKRVRSQYKTFDIYWETYMQTQDEFMRQVIFQELPKVAITFICVIIWCLIGALHTDPLNSKPWHGILGIISTGMACGAGFGARFYTSDDVFDTFLIAIPLMALAIGLDDMFILINSWHNSDCSMPREERAKRTLQEGGTSIFVTVMMTILDFVVGSATPFPAVNTYSNFALWVLAFDFYLQMTIFVPILIMTDSCERKKLQSCCCCYKVKRRTYQKIVKWSVCHIMCCTFGRVVDKAELKKKKKEKKHPPEEPKDELLYMNLDIEAPKPPPPKEEKEEDENEFSSGKYIFSNYVAPVVLHPIIRAVIAILAALVLAGSVYFIWRDIEIGFHPAHLANRKSNTYEFKLADWKYFRDFTDALQLEVLLDFETAPYQHNFKKVYKKVMEIVEKIEEYDAYIWGSRLNRVPFRDVDLRNISSNYTLDDTIRYIADHTSDISMKPGIVNYGQVDQRVVTLNTFQIRDVSKLKRGADLARRLKELQTGYEMDRGFRMYITDKIKVLRVFDQIVNLPNQFVTFTLITVACTVLTAIVMIPNIICMFWMALSSIVITIETMAGMVLWGVSLDPVSFIYILMAVGATADYICHCIYTFTVIEYEVLPEEVGKITWATIRYRKARNLLGELIAETGPAVVGTVLSIIVLSTSYNYVLESFFKVFIISVFVAIPFSMMVLPSLLCQFGPVAKTCCEPENIYVEPKVAAEESEESSESELPVTKPSDHFCVSNEKAMKKLKERQRLEKEKATKLAEREGKDSNGGDHRRMVIEDVYEDVMKIRLMRRFLREARNFAASFKPGNTVSSVTSEQNLPRPVENETGNNNGDLAATSRNSSSNNYSTIGDVTLPTEQVIANNENNNNNVNILPERIGEVHNL